MVPFLSIFSFLSVAALVKAKLAGEGIIGGNYASQGQFPYQVSIQINPKEQWCGGGIIGERFVLTAAHCVVDEQAHIKNVTMKVVVGETDLNNFGKDRSVDVEKIYILKSYKLNPFIINDIAVLKLKQDIGINNGLSKLELPMTGETYAGRIAKISGYGYNSIKVYLDLNGYKHEVNGESDNKLKYLDTRILSNDVCRRTTKYRPIFYTNICGQAVQRYKEGKNEGICSGDSGSPLVINNIIIGVDSTSPPGCEENIEAAVYTRVSSFVHFVNDVMNNVEAGYMKIRNVRRRI